MPDMKASWSLIAHGGAKDILPQYEAINREGLEEAVRIGSNILASGGAALDAVEIVVRNLENHAAYNAGLYGSVTNEDGIMELDASIMDGTTLDIGAVAGLKDIQHPVTVARALLKEKVIFLAGEGALRFAHGLNMPKPLKPPVKAISTPGCDTVGCVALDMNGALAVATSTGGLQGKKAGRVGDVPLPGCGFYADDTRGAASASGDGETISRVMLVSEFLHLLKSEPLDEAIVRALQMVDRIRGEAGLIALTPDGQIGWAHTSQHFAVGMSSHANPIPRIYLKKAEE